MTLDVAAARARFSALQRDLVFFDGPGGTPPGEVAARLGERGFAVWHGNYYALEVMRRLGLEDGAVRVGLVHYNTEDEVDRLLEELERLE